ncbi:fibronectin type III domain-containing protein [Halorussus salinus]|uniref:fibronectin type III domain-containing protein n=1 Tax=Halorussus salinus TaxID=1364935 RepID=UPI0010931669|nr:fibronectin type III domain-containing protein [Halorussus salinus]
MTLTVLEDFESSLTDWSGDVQRKTKYARSGACSAKNNGDEATFTPSELGVGIQPKRIKAWYYEKSSNTGGGIAVYNSNGNYEVRAGTTNPQYSSDPENIAGEGAYGEWIGVEFDFDWTAGEVTIRFYRSGSADMSKTMSMADGGVDVAELRLDGYYNNSKDVTNIWWDDIAYEASSPAAPSDCTTSLSDNDITLSWIDNSVNESGFRIERKRDGGSFSEITTVGANTTTYTDNDLADGETYVYRVQATHASANPSNYSNEASATTALSAPTAVAQTVNSPTSITVSFEDTTDNEIHYRIEKCADDGSWTYVTDLTPDDTSHQFTVAKSADTIQSRVRAESADTISDWTKSATISTDGSELSATTASDSRIDLSWDGKQDAEEYHLYRAESVSGSLDDYQRVATVTSGTTTYSDTNLENGEQYYYRITPVYDGIEDAPSEDATATTTVPAPSVDTVATPAADEVVLEYSLADDSTDGTVEILRSTDGTIGSSVASISDLSQISYTDTSVLDGEKYHYTIRRKTDHAFADSGQTAVMTVLPAPTSLAVNAVDSDQADVSWTTNHDYGNQRVELKPTDDSTWTNDSGELSKSTESYTTSDLLDGEEYDLRVVAYTEHAETEDQ